MKVEVHAVSGMGKKRFLLKKYKKSVLNVLNVKKHVIFQNFIRSTDAYKKQVYELFQYQVYFSGQCV